MEERSAPPRRRFPPLCFSMLFAALALVTCAARAAAVPGWVRECAETADRTPVDPEAIATCLLHDERIEFEKSGRATIRCRVAYRIDEPEGLAFGVLALEALPGREIRKASGWTRTADRTWHEADEKSFLEFGEPADDLVYTESRLMANTLPGVSVGVIVALETEIREEDDTSLYQMISLSERCRIVEANLEVEFPRDWRIRVSGPTDEGIRRTGKDGGIVWEARDLPALPSETLVAADYAETRTIVLACHDPERNDPPHFASWSAVVEWVRATHAQPATPNARTEALTRRLCGDAVSTAAGVHAVADFVQDEVRYVSLALGKGRWIPRPASRSAESRFGDCKDKTTLLRCLLASLDIPSIPVLVNTERPLLEAVPSPYQFNHVIVGIEAAAIPSVAYEPGCLLDGWLLFDPTDPSCRLGAPPDYLEGKNVLLVREGETGLSRVDHFPSDTSRRSCLAKARLNDHGQFVANVRILDSGRWARSTDAWVQSTAPDDRIEYERAWMSYFARDVEIDHATVGARGDSAWVSYTVSGRAKSEHVGDRLVLDPGLFGIHELPVLPLETRLRPLSLGHSMEVVTTVGWDLPEGWELETAPAVSDFSCRLASIRSELRQADGVVEWSWRYSQTGDTAPATEYDEIRGFAERLREVQGRLVVLRRTGS